MKYKTKYGDWDGSDHDIIINGYRLICTCSACPEQYDVFLDDTGEQVGYLRLRGGYFRADYVECGGERVYEAQPEGDGIFDDAERMLYLTNAVNALHDRRTKDGN